MAVPRGLVYSLYAWICSQMFPETRGHYIYDPNEISINFAVPSDTAIDEWVECTSLAIQYITGSPRA